MAQRDEFDDPESFFSRLITDQGRRTVSLFENRSLIVSGVVFIVVVALSGVIWASYPSQNPGVSDGAVPIIRADAEPYKYVPQDRGGMPIPHRDSTIFGAMRPSASGDKVENLLSDDEEQPVDRQQLFAGLKTDLAAATAAAETAGDAKSTDDATAAADAKPVELAQLGGFQQERPLSESERRAEAAKRNRELLKKEAAPLPGEMGNAKPTTGVLGGSEVKPDISHAANEGVDPDETDAPTPVATETAPQPAKAVEEAPADVAKTKDAAKEPVAKAPAEAKKDEPKTAKIDEPKKAEAAPVAVAGSGTSYVQVASVQDAGKVGPEWSKLTSTLPMLSGKPYRVQKADLGAKGVYHRIQVGPFSKDQAAALCDAIKAKKPGGCLIAK